MRLLRTALGALLWIVASVLGLVGVLLCVTIILLPLGLPLLKLAGSLFVRSTRMILPPAIGHPVDTLKETAEKKRRRAGDAVTSTAQGAAKKSRRAVKTQRRRLVRLG